VISFASALPLWFWIWRRPSRLFVRLGQTSFPSFIGFRDDDLLGLEINVPEQHSCVLHKVQTKKLPNARSLKLERGYFQMKKAPEIPGPFGLNEKIVKRYVNGIRVYRPKSKTLPLAELKVRTKEYPLNAFSHTEKMDFHQKQQKTAISPNNFRAMLVGFSERHSIIYQCTYCS
jgi:hypothetical protein